MKTIGKSAIVLVGLIIWTCLGCRDFLFSPFYNPPDIQDPNYPQATLEILTEENNELDAEESCSLEVNRADSVLLLEIQVGEVSPDEVRDRYVRIELRVSVGLADGGLIIADTTNFPVSGPGSYPLVLPIKSPEALAEGKNRVAVIAVTRYLDGSGNLVLPMGREIRYCILNW
ncbi:MAG: hypothetical protein DRN33_06180 [Thermoplasmata archaeon]|nr:MAG: hypothetical protein DRN33_06180 [Thermoplasmata archaeon]